MSDNKLFIELYRHASALGHYPVNVEKDLVPKIKDLTGQDDILFAAVELDPEISLGHIKKYRVPTGVYGDAKWIVEIRYHNDPVMMNWCWRRFVCCKELMHIFDSAAETVDTRVKFDTLLNEIESPPNFEDASEMYKSETSTKWMALAVLCPMPAREYFVSQVTEQKMSLYQVALALRIPEVFVVNILSPYFLSLLVHYETRAAEA